jgi:CRP/FNR family transcriptional regulator
MNIAGRFDQHGLPYEHFRLSMLRRDIANYLGLALETVGRVFKRMESKGYIRTQGRYTRLVDMVALQKLAGLEVGAEHPAVA